MAVQRFAGFVHTGAGVAVNGATIDIFTRNTLTAAVTVPAAPSTNADGYWSATVAVEGRYDVRITNGTSISWLKYDDEFQIEGIEVAVFRMRNPADTFDLDVVVPAITADRQLNWPLITGTDTLACLGLAQTFTGIITFSAASGVVISGATGNTLVVDTNTLVVDATNNVVIIGATDLVAVGVDMPLQINRTGTGVQQLLGITNRQAAAAGVGIDIRFMGNGADVNQTIMARMQVVWTDTESAYMAFLTRTSDGSGATEKLRITAAGQVKIAGTAARATTEGTNHLDIFDGTAPVGTLANGVSLYSTTGELRVMDSGGTATLLSPHDEDGYWVFDSKHTVTGKRLKIHMEKFMRKLEEHFGWGLIEELVEA